MSMVLNHVSFNSFGFRFVGGISCGYTLLRALLFLDGSIGATFLPNLESEDFIFSDFNGFCSWIILLSLPEMERVYINVCWSLTSYYCIV